MMKTTYLIFISLLVISCSGSTEKDTQVTLKDEVLKIHDEAMDKMGVLYSFETKLKEEFDSTQTETYDKAITELSKAQEDMMEWMRNYSKTFPHKMHNKNDESHDKPMMTKEQEEELLKEEKVKIIEIKERMDYSIAQAEKLLSK
ncbi:hypothetical protein [Chondrinema litorale]|uniref:hypothetical protein n=1 Tax=Chondrinema litorale TaxID=2994555 RepID=UPI00254330EB|nr:hypothetical protein [Chondrinema litorale]UZR96386.1 hypothetical protein OQ292_22275 [Chondrinema litorale]